MTKNFGKPNPLTPIEQKLILRENAKGLSIDSIRLRLLDAGFRRGRDFIRTFLRDNGYAANFNNGRAQRPETIATATLQHCDHACVFCDWHGPQDDYYEHWRDNHRTRAGTQRSELSQERRHA